MISKEKAIKILSEEYMRISTEFRVMHEGADDETKAMIEEGVKVWAEEIADKIFSTQFESGGIVLNELVVGDRIAAIKTLRAADRRLGLKEAKDIVEAMEAGRQAFHHIPQNAMLIDLSEEYKRNFADQHVATKLVELRKVGFNASFCAS